MKLLKEDLKTFQQRLLEWFAQEQRPLPWRRKYLPYEVWISEVMLQQTQVAVVIPYFNRWMQTFPTIQPLAKASEQEVLKLWEGLGYYRRARFIHQSAKLIDEQFAGVFPERFEDILSLPGVGRYNAGAIASIAFGQDAPIVDGNVARVAARLMLWKEPVNSPTLNKKLWSLAKDWIPSGQARFFNQAIMELGATICLPKKPLCLTCPVRQFCLAYHQGMTHLLPTPKTPKKSKEQQQIIGIIQSAHQIYLCYAKWGQALGGLWQLPTWALDSSQSAEEQFVNIIKKEWGQMPKNLKSLGQATHCYTSNRIQLSIFACHLAQTTIPQEHSQKYHQTQWVAWQDFKGLTLPSVHNDCILKSL